MMEGVVWTWAQWCVCVVGGEGTGRMYKQHAIRTSVEWRAVMEACGCAGHGHGALSPP